ncbi:MAG: hypothetical protein IKL10_05220 [Clostridia bacterium]|nr:hypothetical protein [Clostridia bacterium]
MFKDNKDRKAKKYGKVSDKPDSALAGPLPTANSEEFVPIPMENLQEAVPPASNDVYDFIPKLKTDKYK